MCIVIPVTERVSGVLTGYYRFVDSLAVAPPADIARYYNTMNFIITRARLENLTLGNPLNPKSNQLLEELSFKPVITNNGIRFFLMGVAHSFHGIIKD